MPLFSQIVPSAGQLMGVKAVWGRSSEPVMCFGSHGDPSAKDKGHFSLARRAAEAAVQRPFLVTIGGGAQVGPELDGRVIEVALVSKAFGETNAFVQDEELRNRLAQWPVAVVLREVYEIVGEPHLQRDLGFDDRLILANAYDGIRRDDERVTQLWGALSAREVRRRWDVRRLPLFEDPPEPRPYGTLYPRRKVSAMEGKRILAEIVKLERDPKLARTVKSENRARNGGIIVCDACGFSDDLDGLFDAHHLEPLARGERRSEIDMFSVLCPTCHRWAHRKAADPLEPLTPDQVGAALSARH